MPKERNTPDDLYPFAQMLVKRLQRKRAEPWSKHQEEDAVHDLFLAGWNVYQNDQNVGLAKNRMTDRAKNLIRDRNSEHKHQPTSESNLRPPSNEPQPPHALIERSSREYDSALIAEVNDTLNKLPGRQRAIVLLRDARFTTQEMADLLGVSMRTVERELELIKKGVLDEQ